MDIEGQVLCLPPLIRMVEKRLFGSSLSELGDVHDICLNSFHSHTRC